MVFVAITEILDGTGAPDEDRKMEPDIISDPGVEGGVDEPNESIEEPNPES